TDHALDLMLVNPGGREAIYQGLGHSLTAVEPPLWVRLIAGYARDRGLSIGILDSEAEELGPEALAARVAKLSPRLVTMVAFGHQPSASTQMMRGAREACLAIRDAAPALPILIVGGHVSALPERTLREEPLDYVCKGEGPLTVVALANALAAAEAEGLVRPSEETLAAVPGLVWWRGDKVVQNLEAPLIKDLDADLHGNVWDLLPMERYRAHNWQCFGDLDSRQPYASIYTSLGCPYRCVFCCINAPFGTNRYRMRQPDAVVAEIQHLHDYYGVHTFKIVDEMFVLNERHVLGICDRLIATGLGPRLNIWAYARVDTVKPHLLERLRRAGFRWLALGIESGSEHVRDGADKAFDSADILNIVQSIKAADINVIGNFIFGLPDDDLDTMRQTMDLALELNCEFANFYSAMAYPGSGLYTQAVEKGWPLPETWSGYSQHSYDCLPLPTEKVTAAEVLRTRDEAFHAYFSSRRYLDMVTQHFGVETRRHIEGMSAHRLRRRLLEENGKAATASAAR
ncbi:MAG TPA: radical SAM protein, partial [Candidatus Udaeobacter sp.]|nr:radical SAM protein [Candidatus Udaeobacter sp.]